MKKLRSQYFNKFRLVEDLEEETKFIQVPAPGTPSSAVTPTGAATTATPTTAPEIRLPEPEDPEDEEPLEIGDLFYQPTEVKKMLSHMLDTIPLGEAKVAILGTYQNVSTGENIVKFIQENLGATSISHAERIGQDLVGHGFLRLVGSVGSTFANSSKMNYQWRPKAFLLTGKPERPLQKPLKSLENGDSDSPTMAYVGDYIGGLLSNPRPGETPGDRLRREAAESDERYKAGVKRLDLMRCVLEESMMDHLKFMERCELDRLKAIKAGKEKQRLWLDFHCGSLIC